MVCLTLPWTAFMCCQKSREDAGDGERRRDRCSVVACARSLLRKRCVTRLRFCLKSSRLVEDGCFLNKRKADHLALMAEAMAGVTCGFLGLRFLTTFDRIYLLIIDRKVDCEDDQAESMSAA